MNISNQFQTGSFINFELKAIENNPYPVLGVDCDGFSLYLDPNSIKNIQGKREILEKAITILNKI